MLKVFVVLALAAVAAGKPKHSHYHKRNELSHRDAKVPSSQVNVDFYFESLCPFCEKFFANQLVPVYDTDLWQHIKLNLIPYGNAQYIDGKLQCQHGDAECKFNKVEACAINTFGAKDAVPFLACIEKKAAQTRGQFDWTTCSDDRRISDEIQDCFTGKKGSSLIRKNGAKTEQVSLQYVPWVVVAGRHDKLNEASFASTVCSALKNKGVSPLPSSCTNMALMAVTGTAETDGRCYKSTVVHTK